MLNHRKYHEDWCCHQALHPPILPLLCKYQQLASSLLCCSKASAALLTFIYICCQRITFLSYERLPRPACLNVAALKFIIRSPGIRLKGPTCDSNVNKKGKPHAARCSNAGVESAVTSTHSGRYLCWSISWHGIFSHKQLMVVLAPNKWAPSCLKSK